MMKTAVIAFLFLGACGGVTDDPGNDAGNGSDATPSPNCPTSVPSHGASCSHQGLTCEYGSDPNMNCNVVAQCESSTWIVSSISTSSCPTPPNTSACPATFATVPVGEHCGALVGTTCSYAQGFCGCSVGGGGPYPEDAAAVATWMCDAPEPGCPSPRPKLGTTCSHEGLQCDYSTCSLPTGASLTCTNGAWQNSQYGCAL